MKRPISVLLLSLGACLTAEMVVSEPKQLVCLKINQPPSEEYKKKFIKMMQEGLPEDRKRLIEVIESYNKNKELFGSYHTTTIMSGTLIPMVQSGIEFAEGALKLCADADHINKWTVKFDTDGLTQSTKRAAEFSHSSYCGANTPPTRKVEMTSTPSILSFTFSGELVDYKVEYGLDGYTWNVDRETLQAGFGTDRGFQCELKEVDVSRNKI